MLVAIKNKNSINKLKPNILIMCTKLIITKDVVVKNTYMPNTTKPINKIK